jgi:teichuronic acid biosynthesis glycosyltransferase TuaC
VTRVLYYSSLFPTRAWPHMGMFSVQRVLALRKAGCEVEVVCPVLITLPARLLPRPRELARWVRDQLRLPAEDCYQGIRVHHPKWFWFPKGLFGWRTSHYQARQVRGRFLKIAADFQPDVVLASWLPDGVAARSLSAVAGLPTIAIADGSDVNFLPREYRGWSYATRTLNAAGTTLVFVSRALRDKAAGLGLLGGRQAVLYNAVDTERFQPPAQPARNQQYTVLTVGRLAQVKGINVLLDAFASLYRQLDGQARLVIVGEGPLEGALLRLAEQLGILPAVDFAGAVKHEAIAPYFQQADVFCLPSFSEGSPAVVVEAMACGCPVVASEVGGLGEMIHPALGLLVPAGDPQALQAALLRAKDHPWDRAAIRREMEARYAWEQWTDKMLALIDSAGAQGRAGT